MGDRLEDRRFRVDGGRRLKRFKGNQGAEWTDEEHSCSEAGEADSGDHYRTADDMQSDVYNGHSIRSQPRSRSQSTSSAISRDSARSSYSSYSSSSNSSSSRRYSSRRREVARHPQFTTLPLEWWERSPDCRAAKADHTAHIDAICESREHLVFSTTLATEDIVLETNMFPYNTPNGVEHYTLWSVDNLSHNEVVTFVDNWLLKHMPQVRRWQYDDNLGERSILIYHVHVFIETIPFSFYARPDQEYFPPHVQAMLPRWAYDLSDSESSSAHNCSRHRMSAHISDSEDNDESSTRTHSCDGTRSDSDCDSDSDSDDGADDHDHDDDDNRSQGSASNSRNEDCS